MPLGGMLYALFAGWWVARKTLAYELDVGDAMLFRFRLLLTRVVAPVAVTAMLSHNLSC